MEMLNIKYWRDGQEDMTHHIYTEREGRLIQDIVAQEFGYIDMADMAQNDEEGVDDLNWVIDFSETA